MAHRGAPIAGLHVWIVGASSGIGESLAVEMRRRGARVAITGRRRDRLTEVAGDGMLAVAADATDPEALTDAAGKVADGLGGLDMVVYSAGFWERTRATSWDPEAFARHVEVNLLGLNNTIAAVLPGMVDRGRGHLVGIASVAGYRGLPGAEAYGATKAAQINLLESLRGSLRGHGVAVTTVCPGFVRTRLTEKNTFSMPFLIDPDQAARHICDGIERGRVEIVFPLPMALAMKAARLVPVRAWAWIIGRRRRHHRQEEP